MAHKAACLGIIELSHEAVEAIRTDTASGGGLLDKMEAAAIESAQAAAGENADVEASSLLERDCVQLIVHVAADGEAEARGAAACGVAAGLAGLYPFCLKIDPRARIAELRLTEFPAQTD